MAKTQKIKEQKSNSASKGSSKGSEKLTEEGAVPAVVEFIAGRTGTRGELTQVKCRVLKGRNQGKQMRRNVRGPVRKRDVLMLRETEIEARRLRTKISKGVFS